jgi:gliding motility-associated-like protein
LRLRIPLQHNKSIGSGLHGFVTLIFILVFSNIAFAQSTLTLDSVSVNENNHVIIGWTLETEVQDGYIEIHRRLPDDTYAPIIQLPITQTSYLDAGINAGNQAYSYYVVARYPNGDSFAVSPEAHQTIFQKSPAYSICDRQIFVSWNNYRVTTSAGTPVPLPVPFESSGIIWSFNGEGFVNQTEVALDAVHLFFQVAEEGNYCFKIRSNHSESGITSTSNIKCIDVKFAPAPEFMEVRRLSLDESSENVEMDLLADNAVNGAGYILQRWDVAGNEFVNLDTIISSEDRIRFLDNNPLASERSEKYRVQVLDSCMAHVFTGQEVSTIYASVISTSATENLIEWNFYEGWNHGVYEYVLLRQLHGMTEFDILDRVDPFTRSYIDNLSSLSEDEQSGVISYRIMAVEMPNNHITGQEYVLSNIATLERETDVFIPNAFKPDSAIPENRVFKPRFVFFTPSSYNLTIFNRWGERIFSSDDYTTGWDGRMNGREANAGVYSFVIRYTDHLGKSHEKPGTLVLVR